PDIAVSVCHRHGCIPLKVAPIVSSGKSTMPLFQRRHLLGAAPGELACAYVLFFDEFHAVQFHKPGGRRCFLTRKIRQTPPGCCAKSAWPRSARACTPLSRR